MIPLDVGLQHIKEKSITIGEHQYVWSKVVHFARKTHSPLKCEFCGAEVDHFDVKNGTARPIVVAPNGQFVPLTRDHILPRSRGGTYARENIRLLCEHCNSTRGNTVTLLELVKLSTSHQKALRGDRQIVKNDVPKNMPKHLFIGKPEKIVNRLRGFGVRIFD